MRSLAPALRRTLPLVALLVACASTDSGDARREQTARVERAQAGLEQDPLVDAQVAAVEAARRREASPRIVDEFEVRLGDQFISEEHRLRVLARVPINRPSETRARREVLAAETRMAVSRLEQVSLQRRAELCFPSVEALAAEERRALYADYAAQRTELLAWNADWRRAGTVDELRGARFELESRTQLASWRPEPTLVPDTVVAVLPEIPEADASEGELVRRRDVVLATVERHNPSVALRRATAERYRALAERAQARNQPWLKFVDLAYEYRTGSEENGVSGQLAFEFPLGGERPNVSRYQALLRGEQDEARGVVEEQVSSSLRALADLHAFETQRSHWRDLLRLADEADEIAARWWRARLARPGDVGALLDEAFTARNAVLEARERAGGAYCTLLAMSGVEPESWPRQTTEATPPESAPPHR